ncbi:MAG: ATP-binding cassette domain-containing protein, partial [Planctomycetes bacterium]|nr:ATP-binding cassette domain-containing protein [Planctomycetota bacterium]
MIDQAKQSVAAANHDHVAVIELIDVHKRFDDLVVLNGVNLTLESGQTTVIIGESGAGKSVLLKHIVRLLKPDSGAIHFHGRRID